MTTAPAPVPATIPTTASKTDQHPDRHLGRHPGQCPDPSRSGLRGRTAGSIFQEALGPDFDRLHPEMRRRFGFSSRDGIACIGTGRMERIWHGSRLVTPFLRLGSSCNILFPEHGRGVPFSIANYAYLDGFGRETVTFVRTFQFTRARRFDATMIASDRRPGTVVDYLGTRQHLAVDLEFRVSPLGGLVITSG
ncbi:DUF4166 domain-containing protein, partial [Saccharothrix sp. ST-888]|uniref:DUF4166 domain-containing protein n=1 Tax=Saccharothrix sp. ST-888 TaxID=1427391 RepID=UPI000B07E2DC